MADPELSLQSILMVSTVIGRTKTFSYVGLVSLFSIIAGLLYGHWDRLALILSVLIAVLGIGLALLRQRQRQAKPVLQNTRFL
jgi:hypothetical protein